MITPEGLQYEVAMELLDIEDLEPSDVSKEEYEAYRADAVLILRAIGQGLGLSSLSYCTCSRDVICQSCLEALGAVDTLKKAGYLI